MLRFPGCNRNLAGTGSGFVLHQLKAPELPGPNWQVIFKANRAANILREGLKLCAANMFAVPNYLRTNENERQRERPLAQWPRLDG